MLFTVFFNNIRLIELFYEKPEIPNFFLSIFNVLLQAFIKLIIHQIDAAFGASLLKIESAELCAALGAFITHHQHLRR